MGIIVQLEEKRKYSKYTQNTQICLDLGILRDKTMNDKKNIHSNYDKQNQNQTLQVCNKNSIKVPNVFRPTLLKKTFGTSVIYSQMSPPSLHGIT